VRGFSWIDAGKFLTGFSAVGSVAIPAILYHAQVWPFHVLMWQLPSWGHDKNDQQ
jgi:hypothetical protein